MAAMLIPMLIPMLILWTSKEEFSSGRPLVLTCRHGGRSKLT
jgi:rhodanese-related sulfurtransferase